MVINKYIKLSTIYDIWDAVNYDNKELYYKIHIITNNHAFDILLDHTGLILLLKNISENLIINKNYIEKYINRKYVNHNEYKAKFIQILGV